MSPLLLAPLMLAAVLILSGVMKLRSPEESASAFTSLQLPNWLNQPRFHRALPIVELVLAGLLLIVPSPLSIFVALVVMGLMLIYVIVIGRALSFGYPVDCSCFGNLGLGEVTVSTLARNMLLAVVSIAALAFAVLQPKSPLGFLFSSDVSTWGWLLGAIVTAVLAVLILGGVSSRPTEAPVQSPRRAYMDEEEELEEEFEDEAPYLRVPTPAATVVKADGSRHSVRQLARAQAQLLVFLSPSCGSCMPVIEKMEEMREKVAPVALREVFMMQPEQGQKLVDEGQLPSIEHALFDPDRMLSTAIEIGGTPGAVLLGTDDLLAGGPVAGGYAVFDFVDDVAAQLQTAMPAEDPEV